MDTIDDYYLEPINYEHERVKARLHWLVEHANAFELEQRLLTEEARQHYATND